ncbi:MAG: hypothetical protein Q8J63_10730 [Candidatus Aquicultor sp.]|nr:hypothetical protein [Candidatus Aquicultor sp.]
MDEKQKEEVALFRYTVIRVLLDEHLEAARFSARLKEVAQSSHKDGLGNWRRISKRTLKRWMAAYKRTGFTGLYPKERCDIGTVRATDEDILDSSGKPKTRSAGQKLGGHFRHD